MNYQENFSFDRTWTRPGDYNALMSVSDNRTTVSDYISCSSLNISTGVTFQNVSSVGGNNFDYDYINGKCNIVSSSASDGILGTGIRSILLSGLDSNFDPITEIIVLNGITSVTSTNNFQRINHTTILTSGDTHHAAGDITCSSVNFPTNIHFKILASSCDANINRYCIPNGHTGAIGNASLSSGSADEVLVRIYIHSPILPIQNIAQTIVFANSFTVATNIFVPLPEKTDLIYRASSVVANNRKLSIAVPLYLVKDKDLL